MAGLYGPDRGEYGAYTPPDGFDQLGGPQGHLIGLPGGDEGVRKTLAGMVELTKQGMTDPNIRALAIKIVRSCKVKDFACEAKSIFKWVQDNLRWTRDVYKVETLQLPIRTIEFGGGDCDCLSIVLASLLLSIGIGPVRFKVIAANPDMPREFSHVYVQVQLGRSWVSLDPSPPGVGFGWEHAPRFREQTFPVA